MIKYDLNLRKPILVILILICMVLTGCNLPSIVESEKSTTEQEENLLVQEQSDKGINIYFLEGQEEEKFDKNYVNLNSLLKSKFILNSIDFKINNQIPSDADALIVLSPKTDLSASEEIILSNYLSNGGRAIFLFDSLESNIRFPNFETILSKFNINLGYDKVRENDVKKFMVDDNYTFISELEENEVNNNLSTYKLPIIMSKSRSIKTLNNINKDIKVFNLLKTSDQSVSEEIQGGRVEGPLNLAVASELIEKDYLSRVVVIGNSNFISDTAKSQFGTYSEMSFYFFINTLDWVVK